MDGGSNGQKNITFDLSIGGERSRRPELIQVDVYVVDKHSGKCGEEEVIRGEDVKTSRCCNFIKVAATF